MRRFLLLPLIAVVLGGPGSALGAARKAAPPSHSALTYKRESGADLAAAKTALARMLAVKGGRTIANTLEPYNDVEMALDRLVATAQLMEEVHPDSVVRVEAQKAEQAGQKLSSEISTDPRVYRAIQAIDVSAQDAGTKFWIFKELRSFRRSGVDQPDSVRKLIRSLNEEMVRVQQSYDRNLSEDKSSIQVDPKDLEGMPQDYIKGHPAGPDGKVTLSTEGPDFFPFTTYARSGERREQFLKIYLNRAMRNVQVLDTLLAVRNRLAGVLGYRNWADYATEVMMIRSDSAADAFINRISQAADKRMHQEYGELLERKKKDDPSATEVKYSEAYYYSELLKSEKYNFSSQEVRPYFEYNEVKKGILDATSHMFGVRYVQVKNVPVWHPSVEVYDVYEGKVRLGRFFLDMHPRPNKYTHAANFAIQSGVKDRRLPMAALVCNLPAPRAGEPALLEHDDVDTFFHEFGHLLHHIFGGRQRWVANSGISTENDFVEAPSQMLEEWIWDAPTLQTFARHYKTGQPIPAEMIQRMRTARDWSEGGTGKGLWVRQQMYYAAVSLYLHDRDPNGLNTTDMVRDLQAKYSPWPYVPDSHMQAGFTHLSGYSAVYYTYMWSLVIAKDMFSAFQAHPLLDPEVATRYRKTVLEGGGSAPAAELVHRFLGRDYSTKPYEDWLNEAK